MNTYAAIINSVTRSQGDVLPILNYNVSFTKNGQPFSTVIFNTSYPDSLDGLIKQQIETYLKADQVIAVADNPPIGAYVPPVAAAPNDQQIYNQNVQLMNTLKSLVDAGVTAAQKDLESQVALVNSQYVSSYYGIGVVSAQSAQGNLV